MSLVGDVLRGLVAKGFSLGWGFRWTWYKNMKDRVALLDAIHLPLCRPEYQPKDGVTYCNQYVAEVCAAYGFKGLDGFTANEIVDTLSMHDQWSEIPLSKAQDLANEGTLIVAGIKEELHGHVNIICPGKEKTSGRWISVPSCANVGKEVFIGKGINWAFSDLPKLWAWRLTL